MIWVVIRATFWEALVARKGAVSLISSALVRVNLALSSKSCWMVSTMGSMEVKYGINSGTKSLSARMLTSENRLVFSSHRPSRCHMILFDWYITTMGQPTEASCRVALPLAVIAKSAMEAVSATERMAY